jgi:hypothetical protein
MALPVTNVGTMAAMSDPTCEECRKESVMVHGKQAMEEALV